MSLDFEQLSRLNAFNLDLDIEEWGFKEYVLSLMELPQLDILPSTPGEVEAVQKLKIRYIALSLQFQVNELGYTWLSQAPAMQICRQYSIEYQFSQATLRFCRQIYHRLQRASHFHCAEELWFFCESCHSQLMLSQIGLTGKPDTDTRGYVLGKTAQHRRARHSLAAYREWLKGGEPPPHLQTAPTAQEPDAAVDFGRILLDDAGQMAEQENDEELETACQEYANAYGVHNQAVKNTPEMQIPYIDHRKGELKWTGKGSNPGKPYQATKPKRPKGRPPKQSH